jgi:hypothetical protein
LQSLKVIATREVINRAEDGALAASGEVGGHGVAPRVDYRRSSTYWTRFQKSRALRPSLKRIRARSAG